jgi:hypothetical protein
MILLGALNNLFRSTESFIWEHHSWAPMAKKKIDWINTDN